MVGFLARFSLEHIKVAKLGALRLHELHAPQALAMPKQPPRHSLEAVLVPWCVRFASWVFFGIFYSGGRYVVCFVASFLIYF